jgi:hypothetical protein
VSRTPEFAGSEEVIVVSIAMLSQSVGGYRVNVSGIVI